MLYLLVGLGGAIGAISRLIIGQLTNSLTTYLPINTLIVNVVGCFLIGYYIGHNPKIIDTPNHFHPFFVIGFLGAFTTFSSFAYETMSLYQQDKFINAVLNVFFNLVLCLAFVVIGHLMASKIHNI